MKQKILFEIREVTHPSTDTALMKLSPIGCRLPEMQPGQFVNVLVPDVKEAFLRRPISICNVADGQLWLYIKNVGKGSAGLVAMKEGQTLDILVPLGNGFNMPAPECKRPLLTGGGVGIAPLLYLGKVLKENGFQPSFLLGARSAGDFALLDEFYKLGDVALTTDDGSRGVHGTVMAHPWMSAEAPYADAIFCCGPTPMMKAVGKFAVEQGIPCEVSLENHMACGIGACLCCVENTKSGHQCVCSYGPVFNINELNWQPIKN